MLIRDTPTAFRLEVGSDDSGELQLVMRWCAPNRRTPKADEEDQLSWFLGEMRRHGVPVVILGADVPGRGTK